MLVDTSVVRVGVEIEVPIWDNERTFHDVARELLAKDHMIGGETLWEEIHTYSCDCKAGGCRTVRSGDVIVPPIVSMTYDASLPETGAEFVTSTVLLADHSLDEIREIWDIVVKDAVWTDQLMDKYGNDKCSPSVHLHVSATTPQYSMKKYKIPSMATMEEGLKADGLHVLSLFVPELFALASTTSQRRGLHYRQPVRWADKKGHHGFIDVRHFVPGELVYIEWRLFEAAYSSWEYVESCAFLASTLTRALLVEKTLNKLMAAGYSNKYDQKIMLAAFYEDDLEGVLALVDGERFNVLRDLCMREIEDDTRGGIMLARLFDRAEANYVV
jgi:hypothetical protein